MLTIEKIYVILGQQQDDTQLEGLCRALSSLFSHVNLTTSNLYLVTGDLPESMPHVERIQKNVSEFLKGSLFSRLYVHFVHPAPKVAMEEINSCYQYLKRATREFDQEGFVHQEVPRLILLPVIIPDHQVETRSLTGLLDALKSAFLLPSLYLDKGTFFLARDEGLLANTEKIYYSLGDSREMADIVCNLYYQDILEDSSAKLESGAVFETDPCPRALIISAQDGTVYSCIDAFRKDEVVSTIHGKFGVDHITAWYDGHVKSKRDCLGCRGQVAESFADLPLPEATAHEVGALLYRFGTLSQEAENHVRAIEYYKKSLKLSPKEEASSIFFRLGLSYISAGYFDQALEAFDRVEGAFRDQYYFYFYTGLCYFQNGDYRVALGDFSNAVRLHPQQEDLARILIYMGTCHNNLGEYEEALIQLERAKEMAGSVKEIYNALGLSYYQLKDYDKAIENLSKAVEIDPYSAIDYASLGSNYREKGNTGMAIAMYEKALALDPSMTSAMENLAKLKGEP